MSNEPMMKSITITTFEKVKHFFEGHPVHSFRMQAIANHLGLSEREVNVSLILLIEEGFIDAEWRLAHPENLKIEED